jgi:hypothetical protein
MFALFSPKIKIDICHTILGKVMNINLPKNPIIPVCSGSLNKMMYEINTPVEK